jgi:hypothetical protein
VKRVCVFSGSSPGGDLAYRAAATDLGHRLAERGIELVYGGASVGLMGAVADAAMEGGGHVIGVIPQSLVDREIAHPAIGDLRVVESMHERKALMADLSTRSSRCPAASGRSRSCSRSTPGTSSAARQAARAVQRARLLRRARALPRPRGRGALHHARAPAMLLVSEDLDELIDGLDGWQAPRRPKWIDRAQS